MHLIINEIPLVRLPSPVIVCNESSGQGDDAFSLNTMPPGSRGLGFDACHTVRGGRTVS